MIFLGIILVIAAVLIGVFLWWQDNSLQTEEYEVESPVLPGTLDGCKILHLSDLHNKSFGPDQKRLVEEIEKIEPDLILISGDMIDKRRTKEDSWGNVLSLIRQAAQFAPVFFVSGNHEWESGLYAKLRPQMETLGAEVLDNGFVVLDHGEAALAVMGVSDPAAFSQNVKEGSKMEKEELPDCMAKVQKRLEWMCGQQEEGAFQVLIAHRPSDIYAQTGVHLIFCGHAHGGQIRLFGKGLYAPDQGTLPKYTEGPYIIDNTVMIVNRGLGNSGFPFRIFNRPQLITVILRSPDGGEEDELEETITEETADSQEAGSLVPEGEPDQEEASPDGEPSAEELEETEELPPSDQVPQEMVLMEESSDGEETSEDSQEPIPEEAQEEEDSQEESQDVSAEEEEENSEETEDETELIGNVPEEPSEDDQPKARSVTPEEKEAFERMLEDAFPDEDKASLMESVMALGDDMDEETFRQMMEGAFSEMNQEPSSEEEPQILNP